MGVVVPLIRVSWVSSRARFWGVLGSITRELNWPVKPLTWVGVTATAVPWVMRVTEVVPALLVKGAVVSVIR